MDKIQVLFTPVNPPFKSEIIWFEYHKSHRVDFHLQVETGFLEETTMNIFKLKQQILSCFFSSIFAYSLGVTQ